MALDFPTSPTNGQEYTIGNNTYVWDSTATVWDLKPVTGGGASTLVDLTDTTITTPTDAQVLTYDTATSKWINADATGGSGGGIGEFISTSIAISSNDTALANDDGTTNGNIGLGSNALNRSISGSNNVGIGEYAGYNCTTTNNVAIGNSAGFSISSGQYNVALGAFALDCNFSSGGTGSYNSGIGYQTGDSLTTGQYNVLNGYKAGYALTSGSDNVLIGKSAGLPLTVSHSNTMIGALAGSLALAGGEYNVFVGAEAGGSANHSSIVALGYQAGYNSGYGSVHLGYQAGGNDTGNYKLHIANKNTESLIEGDFSARTLQVNGSIEAEDFIGIKRHIAVIAVEKSIAIVNGSDILGAIEVPFDCTIVEIRAKTATGTATIAFKNGGLAVGSVAATSTGISNTTLTNTSMSVWDDLTIDVSSASGNGLAITIIVKEV